MNREIAMSQRPEPSSWRDRPMREVNIEMKGSVEIVESERGYPWREQLDRREGKFLELAGPTKHFSPDIVDFSKYRANTVCTNLTEREGIDQVADATKTPFQKGEFRAVLISSFRVRDENRKFRKPEHRIDIENAEEIAKVAQEAWRVLAPGGLLVWLHLETEDELRSIEAAGFVPVYSKDSCHKERGGRHRYQMVYLKEVEK